MIRGFQGAGRYFAGLGYRRWNKESPELKIPSEVCRGQIRRVLNARLYPVGTRSH